MFFNKLILILIFWQQILDYIKISTSFKESGTRWMLNTDENLRQNLSINVNESQLLNDSPINSHFSCKKLIELKCRNGKCITLSKYCDGVDDCGDGSDETSDCTKCNRTFYGHIDTKYSLYFKEPVQKFHPYLCKVTFAAVGGQYGDIIELTFLSFLVGSFLTTKNSSTCAHGYLKINEENTNVTYFGGKFCGQSMTRKVIYYSEANKLSLNIYLPEGRAFYGQYLPLNVYLTYRFLSFDTIHNILDSKTNVGLKLPTTYCDYTFDNCLSPKKCKIFSPNYPGLYPRNLTCRYLIYHKELIPNAQKALVSVSQPNEYKISIYPGSSSSGLTNKAKNGLVFDCELDTISIYDGPSQLSSKLVQFCGFGHLPPIVSTSNQMLIVFESVASNVLTDSRFELEIEIKLVKKVDHQIAADKSSTCDYVFESEYRRRGLIQSPKQPMAIHSKCNYHIISNQSTDKIWIQFVSYFVQDLNQWSSEEKCDSSKVEIFEKVGNLAQASSSSFQLLDKFCEKKLPKICGRLFNNLSHPLVPCANSKESYLSKGPALIISQTYFKPFNLYSVTSKFSMIYEFIDTFEFGEPIVGTFCDRRFTSAKYPKGILRSSRNLFYYGRGGNPNFSCGYYFYSKPNEKLKLDLISLKLMSSKCHQIINSNGMYQCQLNNLETSLNIFDTISNQMISVACFCNSLTLNSTQTAITFNLIGSYSVINFTVTGMNSFQDFDDFNFEAKFEFLPNIECSVNKIETRNNNEGEMIYMVPSDSIYSLNPIKCRWLLVSYPGQQLSIKFLNYKSLNEKSCPHSNRYVVYMGKPWRPVVTICNLNRTKHETKSAEDISYPSESVFELDSITAQQFFHSSSTHYNSTFFKAIVEIIGHQSGTFKFKWTSVKSWPIENEQSETLRNTDCVHKCPEINACLSPDSLCDGINHCPSGYDESGQFCSINSLLWILFGSIGLILIISSSLFYVIIQVIRKRPVSSELSVNVCSTIDGNETSSYMLSSIHEMVSPIQEFELQLNDQRSFEQKEEILELDTSQNYYRHAFQQTFQPFYQSQR